MRIVQINATNFGSTGKIMMGIAEVASFYKYLIYTSCANSRSNKKQQFNNIYIGTRTGRNIHIQAAFFTGLNGYFSRLDTHIFLNKIKKINPNIVHLHNLHNCYINLPMLFSYVKKNNIRVVWTLHDCWSFTGQCPYFTISKCEKWKTGCHHCPQYRSYPSSYVDRTKTMYRLKKKWFIGVQNLTIVTPSQWLADLVKQSYLKDYPIKVINNGIDLTIFKPTQSDFRKKYNLDDKFIILGVAFGWGYRKGLDVFIELSKRLDGKYQIVLVGTDEKIDKQLPKNIISIHRTQNQIELAEIYSAADVFVNPTREENFPTVNMESIACGTPVLTFKTGGSPEILDNTCGSVVPCDDINALYQEIIRICEIKPFTVEACVKRAHKYNMDDKFNDYVKLYLDI